MQSPDVPAPQESKEKRLAPTTSQEWNRDLNIVGITIGLMVIKNIAPAFADRLRVLDFCSDKTQFLFLVVTLFAGLAAALTKNNRMQKHLSFIYTSAIFFWLCMGLIIVNLVLLIK